MQYHIDRLEREKGRRTKCLVRIAAYHMGNKPARKVDIVNAKRLVEVCREYEYRKVDKNIDFSAQTLSILKNEILFLNECLRLVIEKDAAGEFIDLLELEMLENRKKEELGMSAMVDFRDLSEIGLSSTTRFQKKKLSIFDKALFGKFSGGYTRPEDRNPKTNDFIPSVE